MSDREDHPADDQLQDPARGDMPVRDADFARRREQRTDDPGGERPSGEGDGEAEPDPDQGRADEGADGGADEDEADADGGDDG